MGGREVGGTHEVCVCALTCICVCALTCICVCALICICVCAALICICVCALICICVCAALICICVCALICICVCALIAGELYVIGGVSSEQVAFTPRTPHSHHAHPSHHSHHSHPCHRRASPLPSQTLLSKTPTHRLHTVSPLPSRRPPPAFTDAPGGRVAHVALLPWPRRPRRLPRQV